MIRWGNFHCRLFSEYIITNDKGVGCNTVIRQCHVRSVFVVYHYKRIKPLNARKFISRGYENSGWICTKIFRCRVKKWTLTFNIQNKFLYLYKEITCCNSFEELIIFKLSRGPLGFQSFDVNVAGTWVSKLKQGHSAMHISIKY